MRFQSFVIFIYMYISCGFSSGCSENFLFIFSVQKFEFNILLLLLLPLLSLHSSCLGFAELVRYENWWFLFQQIWESFGLYFIKYLSYQITLSLSCSIINTCILLHQLMSLFTFPAPTSSSLCSSNLIISIDLSSRSITLSPTQIQQFPLIYFQDHLILLLVALRDKHTECIF